jgi:hypothetical protein
VAPLLESPYYGGLWAASANWMVKDSGHHPHLLQRMTGENCGKMEYNQSMVKIVSAFIAIFMFVIVTELSVYIYVSIFEERYVFRDLSQFLIEDGKNRWRVEKRFSPELGWEHYHQTPFGERRRPIEYEKDFIATFGDSFTWGTDLQRTETWQTKLSERLRRNVFNFGGTAYGTDQALLRYLRDHKKVNVKISILALIPENINRIANVYRKFYFRRTGIPATKPYFSVVDGRVVLNENPIQTKADIERLKDEAYLKEIAEDDYWARETLERPEKRFPYIGLLFDRDFLSQTKDIIAGTDSTKYSEARSSDNLWTNLTYVAIMKHIFATFVEEAKTTGEIPVLMLLPRGQDIRKIFDGKRFPGESVVQEECREKKGVLLHFPRRLPGGAHRVFGATPRVLFPQRHRPSDT